MWTWGLRNASKESLCHKWSMKWECFVKRQESEPAVGLNLIFSSGIPHLCAPAVPAEFWSWPVFPVLTGPSSALRQTDREVRWDMDDPECLAWFLHRTSRWWSCPTPSLTRNLQQSKQTDPDNLLWMFSIITWYRNHRCQPEGEPAVVLFISCYS